MTATRRIKRRTARSLVSAAVGLSLAVLVLGYLIVPGIWQWRSGEAKIAARENTVEQDGSIRADPVDPAFAAALRAAPTSPQSPPLILTYHEIGYNTSPYTVTPESFATHMQLLHDAGWTTITATQLSDWLAGAPLPPHSVMISFDDGVRGVWRYADPILARNQQHAILYIITGFVGTRAPYYMTWPEIGRLQSSGRWDFGSHTHLGHGLIPIDESGNQGPFLANRQYLPDQHRTETYDEYIARITHDLAESKAQLVAHGLPEPAFLSYPFSAQPDDPEDRTVVALFRAAMLSYKDLSITSNLNVTTSRDLAKRNIARMDVLANYSPQEWVDLLIAVSPLDPTAAQPVTRRSAWTADDDTASAPLPGRNDPPMTLDPGPEDHAVVLFAPYQTTMWQDYTVTAKIGGFTHPGDGTTAGLVALARDPQYQVEVSISVGAYQVRQASDNPRVVASGTLPQQLSYKVDIAVRPNLVTVLIDGRPIFDLPIPPLGPHLPAGGIAVSGTRLYPDSPPPQFANLTVR